MSSKRAQILDAVFAAFLLISIRVAFDFASASAFVYPNHDYGQPDIALAMLLLALLAVAVFALIRLLQRRWIASGLLIAVLLIPFSFHDVVDRVGWRFHANEQSYRSRVLADASQTPKFIVFPWENRGAPLTGGGLLVSAVVYDESDEIAKDWAQRTPSWNTLRDSAPSDETWLVHPLSGAPSCHRTMRSLGEHFYYVADEC
jgi:hypothetical protein